MIFQYKNIFTPIISIFLLVFFVVLTGCTISRDYGPYSGKVVDADTGEPIEGAVVFVSYYTAAPNPGGSSSKFADAIEVFTDSNGEFAIPIQKIKAFRVIHGWKSHCRSIVFKPGYGAYPGHLKSTGPNLKPKGVLPENEHIEIHLPKLNTIEARKDNLGNTTPVSVPQEKYKNLYKLERLERSEIGLKP